MTAVKTKRAAKPKRAPAPRESVFQKKLLLELCRVEGVRAWRQNVGTIRIAGTERRFHAGPPAGAADISGIIGPEGWRLEIEVKRESDTRTEEQHRWADFIGRSGGIYIVALGWLGVDVAVNDLRVAIIRRRAKLRRVRALEAL